MLLLCESKASGTLALLSHSKSNAKQSGASEARGVEGRGDKVKKVTTIFVLEKGTEFPLAFSYSTFFLAYLRFQNHLPFERKSKTQLGGCIPLSKKRKKDQTEVDNMKSVNNHLSVKLDNILLF